MILTAATFSDYITRLDSVGVEIIHSTHVLKKLEAGHYINVYLGFEANGALHIGHFTTLCILIYLAQFENVHAYALFSPLHARANKKEVDCTGYAQIKHYSIFKNLKPILSSASEYYDLFRDTTVCENLPFTNFMQSAKYQALVQDYSRTIRFKKLKKASAFFDRNTLQDLCITQILYPLYQAIDIQYLDIDLALGGMDQRKIHMFHSDNFTKTCTYFHAPLLTVNGMKMSKSMPATAIKLDSHILKHYTRVKTQICAKSATLEQLLHTYLNNIDLYSIFKEFSKN